MKTLLIILGTFLTSAATAQDAEKYLDSGYEKYSEENYEGAIKDFNKALKTNDSNPEIYFLRGVSFSSMGEKVKAMNDLQKAVELNPEYGEAYYEIGYIFLTDKNANEAIKAFDKTIMSNPDFAEAWVSRGTAKCMMEDKEGAQSDWAKAKELGIGYTEYMVCD